MSEKMNLPKEWIEQMKPLLGASLPDFLHSYEQPPVRGIRMRPGTAPIADAGKPIPWAEHAYYLPLSSDAGPRAPKMRKKLTDE